ncbi:MAG: EAL domain-containing protein [Lachnospiraceae bacterium]|nr:EAL domain-containing protein [Lachnospiraceae bacterium]
MNEAIKQSYQTTEEGKRELYDYSKNKITDIKDPSNYNSLTGLPILRLFFYTAQDIIKENPDGNFAVIVMDITQFKAVNEFCGRNEGDKLLKFIADCYRYYDENRKNTVSCHIRADNFCMFTSFEDEKELADIATDLKTKISEFSYLYRVIPNFGICASRDKEPAINYLKDCATIAMSEIKGKFYADYNFFDEKMRSQMLIEKQFESDIIPALRNGEIVPFIQPKVNMLTGRIVGGEALARWKHPERGLLPPDKFMPVFEKDGFIINIDESIWEQIFEYIHNTIEEGREPLPISLNVSRMHAYDTKLVDMLFELRDKYRIPAGFITLELTESAFMTDDEGMYQRMMLLQNGGFNLSMDDFGSGYSTLNMLKDHPVSEVKIDKAFLGNITEKKSQIIVSHIIQMLKGLDADIIVEGVEDEEQRAFLVDNGCTRAQGFLFYRPMTIEEYDELVKKQEEADGGSEVITAEDFNNLDKLFDF